MGTAIKKENRAAVVSAELIERQKFKSLNIPLLDINHQK